MGEKQEVQDRLSMKLQLMFDGDAATGESYYFKSFWLDVNRITGFYVLNEKGYKNTYVLFIGVADYRVKKEDKITAFLKKRFVDGAL